MKKYLIGFYHSFPIQLVLLHVKKYQVLLLFWLVVVSAINGDFMSTFGADSLFLAPEYLGNVNAISAAIVGVSVGIFVMSWNVTTFILHSKHFKFLATTSKPFLKYCINNAIIPLLFLIFYYIKAIEFDKYRELLDLKEILVLIGGFMFGLVLIVVISLAYFFRAEKTMMRKMEPVLEDPQKHFHLFGLGGKHYHEKGLLQVDWFFNTRFKLKKPREVSHYTAEFIDTIFKRHHFSAVISIVLAFLFLSFIGLLLDNDIFEIPAAASILIFFSILIAASGALSYWLKSWSFPFAIMLFLILDSLFRYDVLDIRNKAYGLNYVNRNERPVYDQSGIMALCPIDKMLADKKKMIEVLDRWKEKQDEDRPLLYVLNFSGGGTRSATFTMNVLQSLDSLLDGELMKKTFLMTGASGGMLGATYYRELYRMKQAGDSLNIYDKQYVENISKDLLNGLFSSLVARDLLAPAQKFKVGENKYVKDRGYSFENELSENTGGILNKQLKDYVADESNARIPLIMFSSTITRDGRKMLMSTQPISFMMRELPDSISGLLAEPDAVDFCSFFQKQDPQNLRLLTALRINATFPYVLPNVWLPTNPIIDVMDAGIRDNYGQETALRFLNVFKDWIAANTRGVAFIQVRDRRLGDWEDHFQDRGVVEQFTKPLMILQYNWMKIQDYYHEEMIRFADHSFSFPFEKFTFSYIPAKNNKAAALNFHLTAKEKSDIRDALNSEDNQISFKRIEDFSYPPTSIRRAGTVGMRKE